MWFPTSLIVLLEWVKMAKRKTNEPNTYTFSCSQLYRPCFCCCTFLSSQYQFKIGYIHLKMTKESFTSRGHKVEGSTENLCCTLFFLTLNIQVEGIFRIAWLSFLLFFLLIGNSRGTQSANKNCHSCRALS